MLFKKLAASLIDDGVCPFGGTKTRFSTLPSPKTNTTNVRSSAKLTNSICLIGASCLGQKTRLALCVNPESAVPILSNNDVTAG